MSCYIRAKCNMMSMARHPRWLLLVKFDFTRTWSLVMMPAWCHIKHIDLKSNVSFFKYKYKTYKWSYGWLTNMVMNCWCTETRKCVIKGLYKFTIYCYTEKYMWGWGNDDSIFMFEWTNSLIRNSQLPLIVFLKIRHPLFILLSFFVWL